MRSVSQLLLTFLLNACWQIALVAVAAMLCAWLLRGTSARHKHLLWVAALTLALCLPVLTIARLSGVSFFRRPSTVILPIIGPPPAPQMIPSNAAIAPPVSATATKPAILVNGNFAAVLAALYLLFLSYRSLKLLRAWLHVRAIVRSAYSIELPEHIRAIISRCQTDLGVTRVRVLCSPSVTVPITVGSLTPLVILPEPLLQKAETDVLTSAIGHELAHIRRRDYLLNLIYEFISLPFSFHPAAALVKRRIQETRELRCDELVTERLLATEVYARSLVQLASLALPLGRPTSTITVGMIDADILEERVMSMLKRPKINARRKNWLLMVAAFCFFVPCIAAAPFALRVSIPQAAAQEVKQKEERGQVGVSTDTIRVVAWLKKPGDAVERGEVIAKIEDSEGVLVEVEAGTSGTVERLLVPIGEKSSRGAVLATIREPGQSVSKEVAFRAVPVTIAPMSMILVEQPSQTIDHLVLHSDTKVPLIFKEDGQQKTYSYNRLVTGLDPQHYEIVYTPQGENVVTLVADKMTLEGSVNYASVTKTVVADKMTFEGSVNHGYARNELQGGELVSLRVVAEPKDQAELAKQANLTMQQAIQIATNDHFGKVIESRLVRENGQACYTITILTNDGIKTATVRVLMSAIDGRVFTTSIEER